MECLVDLFLDQHDPVDFFMVLEACDPLGRDDERCLAISFVLNLRVLTRPADIDSSSPLLRKMRSVADATRPLGAAHYYQHCSSLG